MRWEEHEAASYAYAASDEYATELHRVVQLLVHLDDELEP